MNPLRIVKFAATAPIHEVRQAAKVLKAERAASHLWDVLDEGKQNSALWAQTAYVERVLSAAIALIGNLPLPDEGQRAMTNALSKVGMVAGAAVTVIGTLQSLPLPPKYQAYVALAGSLATALAAFYHPAPGTTPVAAK